MSESGLPPGVGDEATRAIPPVDASTGSREAPAEAPAMHNQQPLWKRFFFHQDDESSAAQAAPTNAPRPQTPLDDTTAIPPMEATGELLLDDSDLRDPTAKTTSMPRALRKDAPRPADSVAGKPTTYNGREALKIAGVTLRDRVRQRKDIDKGTTATRREAFGKIQPYNDPPNPDIVYGTWEELIAQGREPTSDESLLAARQATALDYEETFFAKIQGKFPTDQPLSPQQLLELRSGYRALRTALENQTMTHGSEANTYRDSALVNEDTAKIIEELTTLESDDDIQGLSQEQITERARLVTQALTAIADQWWQLAAPWIDAGFPDYHADFEVTQETTTSRGGKVLEQLVQRGTDAVRWAARAMDPRALFRKSGEVVTTDPDAVPTDSRDDATPVPSDRSVASPTASSDTPYLPPGVGATVGEYSPRSTTRAADRSIDPETRAPSVPEASRKEGEPVELITLNLFRAQRRLPPITLAELNEIRLQSKLPPLT